MAYDVIVVLGGGINGDGSLPDLTRYRVETGVELYQRYVAPYLLMSGSRPLNSSHETTEASLMKNHADDLGAYRMHVLLEQKSTSTETNAECTKRDILEPRDWKKLVLITSDFHIERAGEIFKAILGKGYKINPIGAPNHLPPSELEKRVKEEKEKLEEFFKKR